LSGTASTDLEGVFVPKILHQDVKILDSDAHL